MITIFGATGYTGLRIARVLARDGLSFRLAGRSAEKLKALSASLPGSPDWVTADVQQPETLPALMEGTRLLINCAGPFTDLGERVVMQAALNGVHYLDMTNELGYRYRVRSYHELARTKQAAVVPACGFEVALSDCAAAVLGARQLSPIDELNVVYDLPGKGASAGTRKSAIRALATSWIAFENGAWTGRIPGGRVRSFDLPNRKVHALSFPSCEAVTVPSHLQVRRVQTWMTTSPGARFWAPVLVPLFARLTRSIVGPLILAVAGGGGLRGDLDRMGDQFTVYIEAGRDPRKEWMALRGQDVYGLTAEIAGYCAAQMLAPGYQRAGVLAPAQAVDPAMFLAWLQSSQGVKIEEGSGTQAA